MARGRPTMKDVAELADVSFKTVSRVVNGEAGVSDALASRVRAAVDQLGYQLNHGAHALRSAEPQVGTVGVIHADIANPFAAAVHAGFERAAAVHDTLLLSGSTGEDPDRQDRLVEAFISRRVDGLVVFASGDAPGPMLRRELERSTPIVFVDRDPGIRADIVMSDHRAGAELATRHLLDHGHRRIGFLGSRERTVSVRERRSGFDDALRDVAGTISTVRSDLTSVEQAEGAVREMFADRGAAPTALFAAQNLAATGAVRELHRLDLADEVAIVAFDHIDIADMVEPGITTVPQDTEELGRRAAELLFARIGGSDAPVARVVVPLELHRRGSGELRPAPAI